MSAKPFAELALNKPACDWLTVTGWHPEDFDIFINDPENAKPEVRLNYSGLREGRVFVGVGMQGEYLHKMMQVSGSDANIWLPALLNLDDATCTHLDVQITIEWPENDLFALTGRLLQAGKMADFRTNLKGDTCYIGSRLSDKFIRVYHKSKSKGLVRFEVSYKKPYASPMFMLLQEGTGLSDATYTQQLSRWLRYELDRVGDDELQIAFAPILSDNPTKPPKYVPKPENDTERWMRKIVAPALLKYVNSHDADPNLLDHMVKIIRGEHGKPDSRST